MNKSKIVEVVPEIVSAILRDAYDMHSDPDAGPWHSDIVRAATVELDRVVQFGRPDEVASMNEIAAYVRAVHVEADCETYSGIYKDQHGVRPGGERLKEFRALSYNDRNEAIDFLLEDGFR